MSDDRQFWTDETDQALCDYQDATVQRERDDIFRLHLYDPFMKVTQTMFNLKGMWYLPNHDDIWMEVVSHMAEKIHKWDRSKGSGFSYFTSVARNHLYGLSIQNTRLKAREQHLVTEESDEDFLWDQLAIEPEVDRKYREVERSELVITGLEDLREQIEDSDQLVLDTLISIIQDADHVERVPKRVLWTMIRTVTDLSYEEILAAKRRLAPLISDLLTELEMT